MNDTIDKNEISEKVKSTFQSNFPKVDLDKVEWSWEVPNKIIEAEFEHDKSEYEVEITVTGHHLLTEKNIGVDKVPQKVMEAIDKEYPQHTVEEAELVTWSTGETFYELDLNGTEGTEGMEVHIDAEGNITAVSENL